MKFTTPFFFLAFFLTQNLSAQITIPPERFTKLIDVPFREVLYETDTDIDQQLQTIIQSSGPDQTWDFSMFNYIDSTVTESLVSLVDPDDPVLLDPNFTGATLTWRDKLHPVAGSIDQDTLTSIRYGNFTDGTWFVRGALSLGDLDMDGTLDTFKQWFSPTSLQITFPIETNSQWFDTTSINQSFMGTTFTSNTSVDSSWVQGWGTLVTPRGSVPALRVYTKSISRIPGNPFVDVGEQLQFFTFDGTLSASIVLEDGRAFYTVSDVAPTRPTSVPQSRLSRDDLSILGLYPNPVKRYMKIQFSVKAPGRVKLQLLDLNGRPVQQLTNQHFTPGAYAVEWAKPASLPPGHYLLELSHLGKRKSRLISVL